MNQPGSQEALACRLRTERECPPTLAVIVNNDFPENKRRCYFSRSDHMCALCRAPDECCHILCRSSRNEAWYPSFLNGKLRPREGKQHTQVTPVLWGHFADHLKGTLECATCRKPPSPSPKLCRPLGPCVPDFYFLCSPQSRMP